MKRLMLVVMVGCGGGSPPPTEEPAPPPEVAPSPPDAMAPACEELGELSRCLGREAPAGDCAAALPATRDDALVAGCDVTGEATCDELVAISFCMARDAPEARAATVEIAGQYRAALLGSSRDTTIELCRRALEELREPGRSMGCAAGS
jgi:hypothetical protein